MPADRRSTPTSANGAGRTPDSMSLHRTSAAVGQPATADRNGYRVVRRGSRYSVFPRTVASELTRRMGRYDALVEVMNGVPFFSPIWCRRPRILFLHHVHGPMWDQILPGPLAAVGRRSSRASLHRSTDAGSTATPSEATREELLELGFRPDRGDRGSERHRPAFLTGRRTDGAPVDRGGRTLGAGETIRSPARRCRRRREARCLT